MLISSQGLDMSHFAHQIQIPGLPSSDSFNGVLNFASVPFSPMQTLYTD